jgi:pectate lyase
MYAKSQSRSIFTYKSDILKKLFFIIVMMTWGRMICPAQLPSFPGASGWGSQSGGGRGGIVIEVTNLNDSGAGSLREAINTHGARTIIFRTGGIIHLQSELQIQYPFVTIAAQTAPGDGIVIKNFPVAIFTHDVVIRGLRIRAGDDLPLQSPGNRDCLSIQSGSYNVIIDHCSFSWASDENVSITDSGVHSITIQWCIISEGLYKSIHPKGRHSMGLLIGYNASKTSVHHNLFAHNADRNPVISGNTQHEVVNNVIYNWKFSNNVLEDNNQVMADYRGNYWKPLSYSSYPELPLQINFDASTIYGSRLYIHDNILSPNLLFLTPAQINSMGSNAAIISDSSLLSVVSTIPTQNAYDAYEDVINKAGALHPKRDSTDKRILKDVTDSTGQIIDCISPTPILLYSGKIITATDTSFFYSVLNDTVKYSAEGRQIILQTGIGSGQIRNGQYIRVVNTATQIVEAIIDSPWFIIPDSTTGFIMVASCDNSLGAYPDYNAGIASVDTDHDGMPDFWENTQGLNPSDADDRNGISLGTEGYTNLEVYLNSFYDDFTANISLQAIDDIAWTIFPNPAHDKLHFNYTLKNEKNDNSFIFYQIVNLNGTVLINQKILSDCFTTDISSLSSGFYFVMLKNNSYISVKKFVKF